LDFNWAHAASRLLKAEIAREGVTLAQLAKRMQALGLQETEASLKNKLFRGTFAMTFFMQAMRALGHSSVDVSAVVPEDIPKGKQLDSLAG
jgi:hypothetical protein